MKKNSIQLIMKNSLYVLLFLLFSLSTFAQSAGRALSKGNEGYEGKHYSQAEASYRIANSKDAKSTADYNLGNTMYKQKLNKEAETAYLRAAQKATTKEAKHLAYHNLGNAYMKSKNYQAAEQAYKNALLNNPKDDETRYNYAVAKKMNKDNPQDNKDQNKDQNKDNKDNQDQNKDNKDQDNKDNKDNQKDQKDKNDKGKDDQKDKDQDKKDGDKDKDKGDKGDKDNKDKNDKGDGEQPKQNNPNAPSKDQIDRILDAMNKDEKGVQQRLIDKNPKGGEKGKAAGQAEKRKKDW